MEFGLSCFFSGQSCIDVQSSPYPNPPCRTLRSSGWIDDADGDDGVEDVEVDRLAVVPEELSAALLVLAPQRTVLLRDLNPDGLWQNLKP